MKRKVFYSELAYVLGILAVPLGVALMERADFGVSMVVAPAYLLYLKVSESFAFFTFGMAEYLLQAFLLFVLVAVLRRFCWYYLFSFVTAVLYGFVLDFWMAVTTPFVGQEFAVRCLLYFAGMLFCAIGVALFFHTYIPPEVYELFVKELSDKYRKPAHQIKTCYDCISCCVAILMSFAFFGIGNFEGVKVGTILCACINGWLIGRCSSWLENNWQFQNGMQIQRATTKSHESL